MSDKRNPLIIPGATPEPKAEERNPLFIPDRTAPQGPRCPKCSKSDFGGRRVMGVITFTCKLCGEKWQGGLAQEPVSPGQVLPPDSYVPPIRHFPNTKGELEEIRRRVDVQPDFRKGALIPEGDE